MSPRHAYDRPVADHGCKEPPRELHRSCLTCPEDICIFERRDNRTARAVAQRLQKVDVLLAAGYTPKEATAQIGVSKRTVYRDNERLGKLRRAEREARPTR